jgi:saccharopine dehydrogenase-like NADP-dependent oxidoreductase
MNNLTGLPLAIGGLMLAHSEITVRGVVAPEACIPPDPFLSELGRRGVKVYAMAADQPIN